MNDFTKIEASKGAFRRKLAAMSISDKLRMLDILRERELAIKAAKFVDGEPKEEPK
ncbi:MAG: hypothetical protein ABL962_07005 [Fimbriimonadaceae bacterium]